MKKVEAIVNGEPLGVLVSEDGRIWSYEGEELWVAVTPLGCRTYRGFPMRWIVLESFVGPRDGRHANHKDLNKMNDHVDNLEWVTTEENIQHAALMKATKRLRKIQDLSEQECSTLLLMYMGGMHSIEIQEHFGISYNTMTKVTRRLPVTQRRKETWSRKVEKLDNVIHIWES